MTLTELDRMEINSAPAMEIVSIQSTVTGDVFVSKKFQKITGIAVQNHGATAATGVARDSPKLVVSQGSTTRNSRITITHTNTTEVFTLILTGEM